MRTTYVPNFVQVDPPPWYKNDTMFKPIKDWTDEEIARDHEIIRAQILFNESKQWSAE